MPDREKLIELLWEYDQMRMMRMSIEECVDKLIPKGLTIRADHEKPPTDLTGKCGGCAYGKSVSGVFGNSNCYVECTNPDHVTRFCRRGASALRQRTVKGCKRYKPRVSDFGEYVDQPPKEVE